METKTNVEKCDCEDTPASSKALKQRQKISTNYEAVPYSFVIFGASGNLALKKIYPSLWLLFCDGLLPKTLNIVGYARSDLNVEQIKSKCAKYMTINSDDQETAQEFWNKRNFFIRGDPSDGNDLQKLARKLSALESEDTYAIRIFYLALPPLVFEDATRSIKENCFTTMGSKRVIIEKPFGHDTNSCQALVDHLSSIFKENQIYRIDHYLGKEMVQNLIALRFCNCIIDATWNNQNIASVKISVKEDFGIEGRGSYFDKYGIVRDVMQNHLVQILSLVAIDRPNSLNPTDIHNEKVKLLKLIKPIKFEDVVLGQYIGRTDSKIPTERISYCDEPMIPKDSRTPTYAVAVLHIENERWENVPFILVCGKALDKRKAEIRIQYKDMKDTTLFTTQSKRNELVLCVQPEEAIYFKMMTKTPGISFEIEETELDLTYANRYKFTALPDAYERLLLDIFMGSQVPFVSSDELKEAWRIFTPVLDEIEEKKVEPIKYIYGCRSFDEADKLIAKNNFMYTGTYKWLNPQYH